MNIRFQEERFHDAIFAVIKLACRGHFLSVAFFSDDSHSNFWLLSNSNFVVMLANQQPAQYVSVDLMNTWYRREKYKTLNAGLLCNVVTTW